MLCRQMYFQFKRTLFIRTKQHALLHSVVINGVLLNNLWVWITFQIFEKKVSEMRRACSQTATTGRKVSGA